MLGEIQNKSVIEASKLETKKVFFELNYFGPTEGKHFFFFFV